MAYEEIKALPQAVAAKVRPPDELRCIVDDITGEVRAPTSQERCTAIENYMVDVLYARSDLERGLLVVRDALHDLQEKARKVPWQNYAPSKPTQVQIAEAKRRAAPELCSSIESAKRLIEALVAQRDRLNTDQEAMSRLYTVITGG